jgi:hypothetical protein
VASERGIAQTISACTIGVIGLLLELHNKTNTLGRVAIGCDSHVVGPYV